MKKIIILLGVVSLFSNSILAQSSIDNGGLDEDVETRSGKGHGKLGKSSLTYYVDISSINQLTPGIVGEIIKSAFEEWSSYTDFSFSPVMTPWSADFKIKFVSPSHECKDEMGDSVLAHSSYPNAKKHKGEMHINNSIKWFAISSYNNLKCVVVHEIGHLIGLEHSNDSSACMFKYVFGYDKLHIDDCKRAWELYGFPNKKIFIKGDSHLISQNNYIIDVLPRKTQVQWSFSGIGTSDVTLTTYSGKQGKCTLSQSQQAEFDDWLRADLKYNGEIVHSITKNVYSYEQFSGTYSQSPYAYNVAFTPSGPPIDLHLDSEMTLTSNSFKGMTITHSGFSPYYFYFDGNKTIHVVARNVSDGQRLYINCSGNGKSYTITLRVTTQGTNGYQSIEISKPGDYMEVKLVKEEVQEVSDAEVVSDDAEEPEWTVAVFNAMTNQRMHAQDVSGESCTINTSGWKPGFYAVQANVNGEKITKKVHIE